MKKGQRQGKKESKRKKKEVETVVGLPGNRGLMNI